MLDWWLAKPSLEMSLGYKDWIHDLSSHECKPQARFLVHKGYKFVKEECVQNQYISKVLYTQIKMPLLS